MHYFIFNSPENRTYYETPVRFTWYPTKNKLPYSIKVYKIEDSTKVAYQFDNIFYNFHTPNIIMDSGNYTWELWQDNKIIIEPINFNIDESAVKTPLISLDEAFKNIPFEHSRIWLNSKEKKELGQRIKTDLYKDWQIFKSTSVDNWLEVEPITEPLPYPNDIRQTDLWRSMYLSCQDALYAIKHLSVYYGATGEKAYLNHAKKWLLEIARWDTEGATARSYNDEAGFRINTALAWGYDWLYEELDTEEKALVKKSLLERSRELYNYVKNDIEVHIKMLDSHGVRSISMTLVPSALALFHEESEAREWLDYIIKYFMSIYTPWGGDDGGWAEGPAYWQTGISYVIDALNLIKKSTGINIFERPFFQNTGDFPLYVYSQDCKYMAFCDMSDLGDAPGLKAGYNLRMLSAFSKSENVNKYMWYYNEAKRRNIDVQNKFYNYGWWNFSFEDIAFNFDYKAIPAIAPENSTQVKLFDEIGWVSIHKNMADFDNHINFTFKSSPFGCVSHSHGDQNAFVLHAFGESLAIQSGYYIGFRSSMHVDWRRETKSKNCILIDGIGQYATLSTANKSEEMNGSAKSQFEKLISANGQIEEVLQYNNHVYIRGNALNAYKLSVDYINSYRRHILFVDSDFFVVIDEVSLEKESSISWLMHGLKEFKICNNGFKFRGQKADMDVNFIDISAGNMTITQCDNFEGVDNNEIIGLEKQWHINATTPKSLNHKIVTLIEMSKKGEMENCKYKIKDNEIIFEKNNKVFSIVKSCEKYICNNL